MNASLYVEKVLVNQLLNRIQTIEERLAAPTDTWKRIGEARKYCGLNGSADKAEEFKFLCQYFGVKHRPGTSGKGIQYHTEELDKINNGLKELSGADKERFETTLSKFLKQ